MGEEIVIELPDPPEVEIDAALDLSVAEEILIDEHAALAQAERERVAADILAAATLAQTAHDLAQGAHSRIDDHYTYHAPSSSMQEIINEEISPEPIVEISPEPEPEIKEDKKPQREHWFYRK